MKEFWHSTTHQAYYLQRYLWLTAVEPDTPAKKTLKRLILRHFVRGPPIRNLPDSWYSSYRFTVGTVVQIRLNSARYGESRC
jgi:hypothetical protein